MKYIVLTRASEYNDEYYNLSENYHLLENRDGISSKLYNTIEEAKTLGIREAILAEFTNWRGKFNSENFDFKKFGWDSDHYVKNLYKHFKQKGYEFTENDYTLSLPKDLSIEAVLEAWNCYGRDLFKIVPLEEI